MRYTLRQLTYFVAASETGSISNAARALNVSQPSISQAIIQLEKQFDMVLFLRGNVSGVRLTPTGEILLRQARAVLAHAEDFEALATNVVNEVSGEIRVACFVNIAPVYMAALTRSFQEKYTLASVSVTIGNQQEVFDAIESGNCELGLTFDLDVPAAYRIDFCETFPPRLIMPLDHGLADASEIELRELVEETFIYLDLPHSRNYFFSLFESESLQPKKTIPVSSFESIRTYVGNGLGYSLLNVIPKNRHNYDGTRVKYIELAGTHRPLKLCCIGHKRVAYRRATQVFIDHVTDFFSQSKGR